MTLSATQGPSPAQIDLTLDIAGLPLGEVSTTLTLTLGNSGYETTIQIPVRLRIGPALPDPVFASGFAP